MTVLTKQEAEIPLNGGMDTKQGAELQSVSTLRTVTDLRWNKLGELEKRPATATTATHAVPSGSVYSSAVMSGVYARGDELFGLTQDHGLASLHPDGTSLTYMRRPFDHATTPTAELKHSPVACKVSRRFVARANGAGELLVDSVATAIYEEKQLVAWTTRDAALATTLHVKVIDLSTGTIVMTEQTVVLGTMQFVGLSAISVSETDYEGVMLTVATSAALPYTIKAYNWKASTNDFQLHSTLTSNAKTFKHVLIPRTGGTYYFGFTDNTSGFLKVYQGTLGSGFGTLHTATHGALGGVAMVEGDARVLIASITGPSILYGSTFYAEVFGQPASVVTLATVTGTAGTDRYSTIHAALETRTGISSSAVVFVTGVDQAIASDVCFVWTQVVDFTTVAPTSIKSAYFPQVACVGAASLGGRAYGVFALDPSTLYPRETPTSLIVARVSHPVGTLETYRLDPVARVCHERFGVLSYDYTDNDAVSVSGDSLYFAMQADPINGYPQTLFAAKVDFTSNPMSRVDLGDGTAVFGNGILHSYDGDTPSEAQPIHRPVVALEAGAGANIYTGTIGVIAVYSWVDAAGLLHRGEPSEAVELELTADSMNVYVSRPAFIAYDGDTGVTAPEITCELYLTAVDGSNYFRANNSTQYRTYDSTSAKNLWWKFTDVTAGVAIVSGAGVGNFPQIYTTQAGGEERASKAPPAFRALTRVGDMLWGVDAEDPSRIWHTKPLVAGYAPEWNTLNTLFLGDSGVGISDVNGVPTVFAEHGIWQIYGEGPNANGVGSFAPARRLPHEVECLDSLSVCRTGSGVLFRGRRGVYLLDTGLALQPVGLNVDANMTASGELNDDEYCRIVYDELSNEAHVLDFDGSHYVFHLLENKWATWTQGGEHTWKDAVVVLGRVYELDRKSTSAIKRIRAIDESAHNDHTYGWSLETPWIRFDGATGDHRIWEIVVQVRVTGNDAGSVTGGGIYVYYGARDTPDTANEETFPWTDVQIYELSGGNSDRTINLRCHITQQRARQFRFRVVELEAGYAGPGAVPIAVRVIYGVTPSAGRKSNTGQSKGKTVFV